RLHAAVGAQDNAAAEAVHHEHLVRFGHADFPGGAGVLDRGDRRGARATVVTGYEHDVRIGLRDARGDRADAGTRDELHAHLRAAIDLLEVEDQLREVLDRVDVVVWRRRDECDTGNRMTQPRDERRDLVAGQLAALTGLCALGHLDLDLLRVGQVLGGDAEATGRHLLDCGVGVVDIFTDRETRGILAAFTGVGLSADAVHRDRENLVYFRRKRAHRHAGGRETL